MSDFCDPALLEYSQKIFLFVQFQKHVEMILLPGFQIAGYLPLKLELKAVTYRLFSVSFFVTAELLSSIKWLFLNQLIPQFSVDALCAVTFRSYILAYFMIIRIKMYS